MERVCGARSAVHENPHKKVVTCNCRQLIERTPPSFLTEHLVLTMHEKHRAMPFPSQHLHIFTLLVLFWPFPRPRLAGFHWIAMIFYTTKVELYFVEYIFWLPSFRHGDIICYLGKIFCNIMWTRCWVYDTYFHILGCEPFKKMKYPHMVGWDTQYPKTPEIHKIRNIACVSGKVIAYQ